MNYITVEFRPFTARQMVKVYQNGTLVTEMGATMSEVVDTLKGLVCMYKADNVKMIGNKLFVSKFAAELQTNFSENECKVEIIEK